MNQRVNVLIIIKYLSLYIIKQMKGMEEVKRNCEN